MVGKKLFTAVKNEGPFMLEWIAYHRSIGFDDILVVSNDSDDGTTELLNRLAEAGVIEHIYHTVKPEESPHAKASDLANKSGFFRDGDWVIWIDADEFLNIHYADGTVDGLIKLIGARQGILINWHTFGDSGNRVFPGRFISEDFTKSDSREYERNKRVKTFYRWDQDSARFTQDPHRPYISGSRGFGVSDFLNGRGAAISPNCETHARWLKGENKGLKLHSSFAVPEEDYGWDVAQINHYTVRTPDVYRLKRHRGRSHAKIRSDNSPNAERHNDKFFREFNRNEVEDRSILRHEAATSEGIAYLISLPGIAEAHAHTCALTAARILEMNESDQLSQ